VTVLNVSQGLLAGTLLGPNPLNMMAGGSGMVVLSLNVPANTEVIGRLYNMAGELVILASNGMQPGNLHLDLSDRHLASGVYILAVTATAPWGTVDRRNFKMVIMR
jgi:hypothetical protein